MIMIIYIVLFVLLLALTFMSFKKFSNNIFCFGTPILGFAIMVLNCFFLNARLKFPIIFGLMLIAGIVLWVIAAKERTEALNSCSKMNRVLGATKKIAAFALGFLSVRNDDPDLFDVGVDVENDPRRFYVDEPSIAIGGKIFNAVYSVSVLVFTIIIAIGNR